MFVLPGGADIPYTKWLNGKGNEKIRTYVEKGGSFLGICAGSYYAGNFVEFALGTPLEVKGVRELAFFPGTVKGPILAPYDYETSSGVRAAKISWKGGAPFKTNSTFVVYYNGGGYFAEAAREEHTKILASYSLGNDFPAIIEIQVGKGKAILSGVHFEYDPAS